MAIGQPVLIEQHHFGVFGSVGCPSAVDPVAAALQGPAVVRPRPLADGNRQIGLLDAGTCKFTFTLNALAGSGLAPGAATGRLDLFVASSTVYTFRMAITLETFVPPPTPAVRIDSVKLSSTTLKIGGPGITYFATVTNLGGSAVTNIGLQGLVIQGSANRAAGGTSVVCGVSIGVLPPGSCTFGFSLIASNSAGGSGILVPGAATAKFDLVWTYGILASVSLPITLVP